MSDNPKPIGEFDEQSLKGIAKEIVVKRLTLSIHWLAYVLVNLLLFIINFLTGYDYPWHLWAITGWGVAVLLHTFWFLSYKHGWFSSIPKTVLGYHLFTYVVVSGLLLFIDSFNNHWQSFSWVWWPIGAWGIFVILHLVLFFWFTPRPGEKAYKSWVDRQVEREMAKVNQPSGSSTTSPSPPGSSPPPMKKETKLILDEK